MERTVAPRSINLLVSIVIPVHDGGATIARALDSVLGQTYEPIEIIVIDDASTDATSTILTSYAENRVRVISTIDNKGPSEARNIGIRAASGDYIAFLDADDEWRSDKLSKQMTLMTARERVTLVTCQGHFQTPDGRVAGRVYEGSPPEGAEAWKSMLATMSVSTPCVLAPREDLVALGGFDGDLLVGEDQDLWIRLSLIGEVACVNEPLVTIHQVADSFMRRNITREAEFVIPMIEGHVARMRGKLSHGDVRRILGMRCAQIGRNLYVGGGYARGARLVLRAITLGFQPVVHLLFLLHASPPGRWLKRRLRGARND